MTVRLISFIKKALSGQYFEQTLQNNLPVEMKNSYQEVSDQFNYKNSIKTVNREKTSVKILQI